MNQMRSFSFMIDLVFHTKKRRLSSLSSRCLKQVSNETPNECLIGTSLRRLNGTYQRLPISMSPRRLLQVPNKTPNCVAGVRLCHVLELRCRDALLVGLYYGFMILCHDLHLLGFHVSFKYQIKHQNFVVPTRRKATRVVWIIN